jgi:hydrogenase maturation protease
MLIIGCGNRDRGDDAAGLIAAERLRGRGVAAGICSGEPSELLEAWAGADQVILIDAVQTGSPTGTVHVWNGQNPPKFSMSSGSTHGLGLSEAIELARALGRLPEKLRIYGIEGASFGIGSGLSREVDPGIDEVVRRILLELE